MRLYSCCFILLAVFFGGGCADRPAVDPSTYGTVVTQLPAIPEAESPFPFPFAAEGEHSNCVFNDADFF